ncbi:MAG: hypothetical protein M1820_002980 [Bogoriella megaspora]|nr:MAG: hypothetical protein M1820_002980 [Bogoriella megaspora]
MSVAEYNRALSCHLASQAEKTEEEAIQSDGNQLSTFDITEKQRPSGDRPVITPTSSVAQARESDNDFTTYALLVRRRIDKDGNHQGTQLEIQSVVLQDALRVIMPECAYLNLAAHPIIIEAPYYELFQYRKEIRDYAEQPDRTDTQKSYLNLLLRFMSANLAKTEKIHSQYHPRWTSTYAILWTYFRPETFIVYQREHYQELYRVCRCCYKKDSSTRENFFELAVWGWDYNGKGFGPKKTSLRLSEFQGARNLTEIDFFPLECLAVDEKAATIARLIARGKKWRRIVDRSHQQYNGPAWVASDPAAERRGTVTEQKDLVPVHVAGRVMVDYTNHRQRNYLLATRLYTQGEPIDLKASDRAELNPETLIHLSERGELIRDTILLNDMVAYANTDQYEITEFQAALAPARVRGFSFVEKRWSLFTVDGLQEITWMESRFAQLQLQPSYKDAVQAVLQQHQEKEPQTNQLMKKGRGLVILLYGAPGTGKTLTAETVSEVSHRPLYYVGVNELMSSYFDDAETVMRKIFDLASAWGAIILIDEADIFMVQRGRNDNHRNGLVATFLRMLEYHEGIVFLTSNRLEDFDEAFESRLHLRLRYRPLDISKKESVWRTALAGTPEARDWTDEDFGRLARELDVNGRQITNLVRTARALASFKKVPLTIETLAFVHGMNFRREADGDDQGS